MRTIINIGRPFTCDRDVDDFNTFFNTYVKQTIADKLEGFNLEFVTINHNGMLYQINADEDLYSEVFIDKPEMETTMSEFNYFTLIDVITDDISGGIDLVLSRLLGKDEDFIILMKTSLIDRCVYFLELEVIKDK